MTPEMAERLHGFGSTWHARRDRMAELGGELRTTEGRVEWLRAELANARDLEARARTAYERVMLEAYAAQGAPTKPSKPPAEPGLYRETIEKLTESIHVERQRKPCLRCIHGNAAPGESWCAGCNADFDRANAAEGFPRGCLKSVPGEAFPTLRSPPEPDVPIGTCSRGDRAAQCSQVWDGVRCAARTWLPVMDLREWRCGECCARAIKAGLKLCVGVALGAFCGMSTAEQVTVQDGLCELCRLKAKAKADEDARRTRPVAVDANGSEVAS